MSGDLPEQVARELAKTPTVSKMVGVFRYMDGKLAVVDVNGSRIRVPVSGAIPPEGPVWVEVQNGRHVCTGTSSQISPYGTVVSANSSKVIVAPDGGENIEIPYAAGLTLTSGNRVAIDPDARYVTAKLSSDPTPAFDPGAGAAGGQWFTNLLVQATDSGTSNGGGYWQNNVNSDSAAGGAWFYGGGLQAALKGVTSFTSIEVYLPVVYNRFTAPTIRLHGVASKPGSGLPSFSSSHTLPSASGWCALPVSWGPSMRDGNAGVGFGPVSGVMASWRGKASDAMSGAIRFSGSR